MCVCVCVCERLTGGDLAYQWYVCVPDSVCVPLDKSACAPAFNGCINARAAALSLPQLCLRWSPVDSGRKRSRPSRRSLQS